MKIEFVSYDCPTWCKCQGRLTLKCDDKPVIFSAEWFLESEKRRGFEFPFWDGGNFFYIEDEYIEVDDANDFFDRNSLPEWLQPYSKEIFEIFIEHVGIYHCGGCE